MPTKNFIESEFVAVPIQLMLILAGFLTQLVLLTLKTILEILGLATNRVLLPISESCSSLLERIKGGQSGYEATIR